MLIAALSPKARDMVRAGRAALNRPTAADRERVQSALRARLGSSWHTQAPTRPASRMGWAMVAGVVGGGGMLGAWLLTAQPTGVAASAHLEPMRLRVMAIPVREPLPTTEPLPELEGARPTRPAPVIRAADRLGQEVALLERATSKLNGGRYAEALLLLDEHLRSFPGGLLAEERQAGRAQALCALSRRDEGLAALAAVRSQSATAVHARELCATPENPPLIRR